MLGVDVKKQIYVRPMNLFLGFYGLFCLFYML